MPATTTSFIASDDAHSLREKIGRALMWLVVLSAVEAAGTALLTVLDTAGATKVVETWRLYGLLVFVGLFALLMLRPHHYKGVWEITIASKLAMTVTAIGYAAHGGITGTGPIIGWAAASPRSSSLPTSAAAAGPPRRACGGRTGRRARTITPVIGSWCQEKARRRRP